MPEDAYKIRIKLENKLLQKHFEKIISQRQDFIIQDDKDFAKTDLMIIELGQDPDLTFELMQNLMNNYEVGEIFLSADFIDHDILTKARWSGAREFFGPGTEESEITSALERFVLRQAREKAEDTPVKEGQVISVMGSKGGVGATTIAVNLAVSLASKEHNKAVALLDMKLFGDIHLFMEIEPSYTWMEITKNISLMDAAFLKSILTLAPSGVHVLPSPAYLPTHNMATPEKIERLFKVMGQMFDFIVVDMGHVLNQTTLKILEVSDRVFLAALQNLPCLAKIHMMQRTFRDLGYPAGEDIYIILNGYVKDSSIGIEDVKESLGKEVFWTIPKDYLTTISAINEGRPLAKIAPKKGVTKSFKELAQLLINEPEERKR